MSTSSAAVFIDEIDQMLRPLATAERAVHEKQYLKSAIRHLGVAVPDTRQVATTVRRAHGLEGPALFDLVDALWEQPVYEHRAVAVYLLESVRTRLIPPDLIRIAQMLAGTFTWALADPLAIKVAGSIVDRHPDTADTLDRWIVHESLWLRRSAMLALLVPLREGRGDWFRFTCYADAAMHEAEFFIRKAIGWVLRETSRRRPALVSAYVEARIGELSPLSFREAVRRLPDDDQYRLNQLRAMQGAQAG